jgi:hypothetical protein
MALTDDCGDRHNGVYRLTDARSCGRFSWEIDREKFLGDRS